MKTWAKLLFAVYVAFGLSAVVVQAAPVGVPGVLAKLNTSNLVTKAHGWHHSCRWGPMRRHRHVPGVGNVRCGRHGGYRCRNWRHECRDRWGHSWRFRRCMRRHGC